ncbi:MAG: phosphoribosylformylglycinamidine synthase subunit PurL, partial [Beijerinckiaceae bacterium]
LSEMAMAGRIGAAITALPDGPAHAVLFGEDQARYLLTTKDEAAVLAALKAAGVPALTLGITGGDSLILPNEQPLAVRDLVTAHEAWLPGYMSGAIDHAA